MYSIDLLIGNSIVYTAICMETCLFRGSRTGSRCCRLPSNIPLYLARQTAKGKGKRAAGTRKGRQAALWPRQAGQAEPHTVPEVPQEPTYRPRDLKPPSCLDAEIPSIVEAAMFQEPFIRDPGNGPRVCDASAFMESFFAQPAALDVS